MTRPTRFVLCQTKCNHGEDPLDTQGNGKILASVTRRDLQNLEIDPRKLEIDLRNPGIDLQKSEIELLKSGIELLKSGIDLLKPEIDLRKLGIDLQNPGINPRNPDIDIHGPHMRTALTRAAVGFQFSPPCWIRESVPGRRPQATTLSKKPARWPVLSERARRLILTRAEGTK